MTDPHEYCQCEFRSYRDLLDEVATLRQELEDMRAPFVNELGVERERFLSVHRLATEMLSHFIGMGARDGQITRRAAWATEEIFQRWRQTLQEAS